VLERYVQQFGVTESISFDGITTAKGNFEASNAPLNLGWSAVGQYLDQVNPCSYLTFVGAVANGGKGVLPHVVDSVSVGSVKTYEAESKAGERVMSAATAELIASFMRNNVQTKYGDDNFPGLTVCAKTGTAEVGGAQKPNAMFTGFVTNDEYPLAFIVCVEDGGYGKQVCVPIASKVLTACKENLS
jgi:peptidoglycan glycosyltransferase